MGKLTVVINTLNEAKNLPLAISSVKDIADEIVVVDMNSDDETQKVAKKLGAKVFTHDRVGYVEPARNFAIEKATGEWVFILDADEEISKELARIIRSEIKKPKADYYRIPRKNLVFGKWLKHSRWWPDYNIRFFKKGKVSWNELIHGVPVTVGSGFDLESKESLAIIHHHYDSIEQYVERLNKYTTIQADLKAKEGYKFNFVDLVKKPVGEFFSRFFAGEGYKDGLHGFSLSLLQAFSEAVVYLKLWQKEGFDERELDLKQIKDSVETSKKDFNYWFYDAMHKKNGGVSNAIKRKFKLS